MNELSLLKLTWDTLEKHLLEPLKITTSSHRFMTHISCRLHEWYYESSHNIIYSRTLKFEGKIKMRSCYKDDDINK